MAVHRVLLGVKASLMTWGRWNGIFFSSRWPGFDRQAVLQLMSVSYKAEAGLTCLHVSALRVTRLQLLTVIICCALVDCFNALWCVHVLSASLYSRNAKVVPAMFLKALLRM